jgi:hypothetical protein
MESRETRDWINQFHLTFCYDFWVIGGIISNTIERVQESKEADLCNNLELQNLKDSMACFSPNPGITVDILEPNRKQSGLVGPNYGKTNFLKMRFIPGVILWGHTITHTPGIKSMIASSRGSEGTWCNIDVIKLHSCVLKLQWHLALA